MSTTIARSRAEFVASTLKDLGLSDVKDLIPLLGSPNGKLAGRACLTLARTGKKTYAPLLLDVLKGKRPSLWMLAGTSLSELESKRMVRPLLELILNPSYRARQREAAAYALAFTWSALADKKYGVPIGQAFVKVLENQQESPGLRGQAAEGLAYLYGPCASASVDRSAVEYQQGGQTLMAALEDPSAEVRFWSVFALGSMRYEAALPALRKLARTDTERHGHWQTVGEEAAEAIECITGDRPAVT